MSTQVSIMLFLCLALSLGGCERESTSEEPIAQPKQAQPRSSPTAWVEVVAPEDLALVEVPAQVVGEPGSRAAIAPVFEGQLVRVYVRPGDEVEAGDPVADLSTPEVTRAAAVARTTKDQLALQRKRLAELERLRDQGLIGSREVFAIQERVAELESERAAAAAILAAAGVHDRTQLHDGALRLRSPTSGTVTEVDGSPGQIWGPNDGPLALIVSEGSARIQASIAGSLPEASAIAFVTREGREVPLNPQPIASAVDPADGMTRVWLVPADEGVTLTHGLRGSLRIEADDTAGAGASGQSALLQVPKSALRLKPDGGAVVLARRGDGPPEQVAVSVESQSGSAALVRSADLRLGDEVAADPALVLGEPAAGGHVP